MSLNSETIQNTEQRGVNRPAGGLEVLFQTTWLRLDSIVTSLLGIDQEGQKYRAAMKTDLRLVALSGLPIRWDQPQFAPYRDAEKVLVDLGNGCR
jgi:hypothetical protein